MVMEFCDHDLTGLTDAGQRFSTPQIKCYMKQLLEGMSYCHKNRVLHRDIKGSNLLINDEGQLKIADFGLARPFDDQMRQYTNRVITLWYRPPELLLGSQQYGPAIDMWSVGCIFAELLLRKPILPGRDEMDQITMIFKLLGTPNEMTWPGGTKLSHFNLVAQSIKKQYQSSFNDKFGQLDSQAQDLLRKLLSMDPEKRISAKEALDHDYFWSEPMPARPEQLPKYPPSHEFTAKKRRQQAQQQQQQQQQQQMQMQMQMQHQQHHHAGQHQAPAQMQPQHAYGYPPPQSYGASQRGGPPAYPAKRFRDGPGGGYEYSRMNPAPPGGSFQRQPPYYGSQHGAQPPYYGHPPTQQMGGQGGASWPGGLPQRSNQGSGSAYPQHEARRRQ